MNETKTQSTRQLSPRVRRIQSLMRALAQIHIDRQPESEKQAPETEWRRWRDTVAAFESLRNVLMEVVQNQEETGTTIEQYNDIKTKQDEEEEDDPYDPIYGSDSASGGIDDATSTGIGIQNPTAGIVINTIRAGVARIDQDVAELTSLTYQSLTGMASLAEDVHTIQETATAAIAAAGGGGGGTALLIDGTNSMTADLNAGNNQVVNVADPVAVQDAVNLQFADANYLQVDGGNGMAAAIDMNNNQINELANGSALTDAINLGQANTNYAAKATLTTKGDLYVRNATTVTRLGVGADGQVPMADSTNANGVKWDFVGDIRSTGSVAFAADQSMGGNKLTNVGNATAGTDALNRNSGDGRYVRNDGSGIQPTTPADQLSWLGI